ncbi:MAG: ATP-binding protein [Erysipelotrichaceae bacterium]|nr:ATP-binding protein [Erysipelotrichaceae bacterium]
MIQRTIKKPLLDSIKSYPVTLVTGARQVGKSTLCYELKKELNYNYVSLDDMDERQLANDDPKFFLAKHQAPLIIDEVQKAPILFEYIESIVNRERLETGNANGMYILTGSQKFKLMKSVTESLAGRVGIINMSPLSFNEINSRKEIPFEVDINRVVDRCSYNMTTDKLFEQITKGFYPELYRNPDLDKDSFYSNYVATYIDRDVSELIDVKNKLLFHKLMQLLASLTGEELIYDNIAKHIGVDKKTVISWISVLEASNIIYLLQPYFETSLTKRVVKRPKIYFRDTGLACYLAKLSDAKNLSVSHFSGHFVETYVVNEIIKTYENTNTHAEFYYYRDNEQNEIDLIIQRKGQLSFIEIKSGMKFSKSDVRAFNKFEKSKYAIGESAVICLTESVYKIDENVYALPITTI